MKSLFMLLVFTASLFGSVQASAATSKVPKGTLFVDWDQSGRCWAFDQQERATKKISVEICREEVGVIYANNRLESFDPNSPAQHTNRRCYEFTPTGTLLGEVRDRSRCD
jgi:hypothetical protein